MPAGYLGALRWGACRRSARPAAASLLTWHVGHTCGRGDVWIRPGARSQVQASKDVREQKDRGRGERAWGPEHAVERTLHCTILTCININVVAARPFWRVAAIRPALQ